MYTFLTYIKISQWLNDELNVFTLTERALSLVHPSYDQSGRYLSLTSLMVNGKWTGSYLELFNFTWMLKVLYMTCVIHPIIHVCFFLCLRPLVPLNCSLTLCDVNLLMEISRCVVFTETAESQLKTHINLQWPKTVKTNKYLKSSYIILQKFTKHKNQSHKLNQLLCNWINNASLATRDLTETACFTTLWPKLRITFYMH